MAIWPTPVKRLLLSLIILSSFLFPLSSYSLTIEGKVVSVHDGDTVTVEVSNGQVYKIRLLGIDTPELAQGKWGYMAKDYLSELILDKSVVVATDENAPEYDKYHRILGYIRLTDRDSTLVNLLLLKYGYAYRFKDEHIIEHDDFISAENTAKSASMGVWSDPTLQIPAQYRKEHKNNNNQNSKAN